MTLTQIKGLGWALLSVFFWGTMFPVGRFLIGGNRIDPVSLGILRFAIGGTALFLAGLLLYRKKMFELTRAEWFRLPFQGLVGASMMALLLFMAQKEIPVINASMLEAIVPLQIFVITLCLGKKGSPVQFAGLLLGFLGCLLVLRVIDGGGIALKALKRGDLLIFLSGLCWAVYTVWGRRTIQHIGGWIYSSWTLLWGAVWLILFLPFSPDKVRLPGDPLSWGWILYFGIGPSALAFYGWNEAQKFIPVALLSLNEYFVPMIAAAFGYLFLHETITVWQTAGAILILGAVLMEPDLFPRKKHSL